jgi:uncharacterized protein YggT (Ycf19 family)
MTTETVPALSARKAFLWVARLAGYLVYFYLIVVEIILFLGFFLLLFGANADAGFADWVYRNLDRAMAPFRGIFTPINLGEVTPEIDSVFDTSILFAMIIYGIVALLLHSLITWLSHRLRHLDDLEAAAEARAEQERLVAGQYQQPVPPVGSVPPTQPFT